MVYIQRPASDIKKLERTDSDKRIGKMFELGNPYIYNNGVSYNWPRANVTELKPLFLAKRDEAGPILLERARKYTKDFEVWSHSPHPYLQDGMNALTVHIGDGGRWVELGVYMGVGMGAFHNLDSHKDQILGFNLISDLLEILDPKIKAPRIMKNNEIVYPLPEGRLVLPSENNPAFTEGWINIRSGRIAKLGNVMRIVAGKEMQEFVFETGRITVCQGVCKATGFSGFKIVNATTLVANIVDSCAFHEAKQA